jgi:hypothetical protein
MRVILRWPEQGQIHLPWPFVLSHYHSEGIIKSAPGIAVKNFVPAGRGMMSLIDRAGLVGILFCQVYPRRSIYFQRTSFTVKAALNSPRYILNMS